jgi:hypothetical protein
VFLIEVHGQSFLGNVQVYFGNIKEEIIESNTYSLKHYRYRELGNGFYLMYDLIPQWGSRYCRLLYNINHNTPEEELVLFLFKDTTLHFIISGYPYRDFDIDDTDDIVSPLILYEDNNITLTSGSKSITLFFDESGRLLHGDILFDNPDFNCRIDFIYDDENKLTKILEQLSPSEIFTTSIYYDGKLRIYENIADMQNIPRSEWSSDIRKIIFSNGKLKYWVCLYFFNYAIYENHIMEYNENGACIRLRRDFPDGTSREYDANQFLEYDERGNWIRALFSNQYNYNPHFSNPIQDLRERTLIFE